MSKRSRGGLGSFPAIAKQSTVEVVAPNLSILPMLPVSVNAPLVLPAPVRRFAWENLSLPPGFEDLQDVSVVAAQPPIPLAGLPPARSDHPIHSAASAVNNAVRAVPGLNPIRQYRGRHEEVMCYCGLRHSPKAVPCDGIAADSAANFHHYLALHPSPVIPVHTLGELVRVCPHCHAQFFHTETINCCLGGTVCVPIPEVPARLHDVICSRAVLGQIRVYNMALSMASTGHSNMSPNWGMFTMGGKTYHRLSGNFVNPRGPPAFAQIYMLDTTAATARRLEIFPSIGRVSGSSLEAGILAQLHDLLIECNPWIGQFRSAGMSNVPELVWHSCGAVNLEGMGMGAMIEGCGKRNIVIRVRRGNNADDVICNIDDAHELYQPLAYVLLFPTGIGGWASWMCRHHHDGTDAGKLTLTKWAVYLMQRRVEGPSHLQSCGVLTSELWCDVWAQVEAAKLGFLRSPGAQARIRGSRFSAVADCIASDGDLGLVGTPVYMPASFVGSAQWYRCLYHDAMALPANFGRPDLFITMTCSQQWPEIQENLPPGADPFDHADIVARVFYAKWMAMLRDIVDKQIFGAVLAFCWRIEWQFRGWPHVHCMLILVRKLLTAQQIDGLVSAEIPDPSRHPVLHHLVTSLMIHGPMCGEITPTARCRIKDPDNCKHHFPKGRQADTVICSNQFPLYRRRQLFSAVIKGHRISDEWVAPYNGLLLLRYRCHVNVEVVTHLKVTKYCYKYVFKKPDEATICIDEIDHYLSHRVLSVSEAVWRILGLRLHQEYPPVCRLDLHLPHQQRVTFAVGEPRDVWDSVVSQTSTLLQWFELNMRDVNARQYT